jgi:hypothetical protein
MSTEYRDIPEEGFCWECGEFIGKDLEFDYSRCSECESGRQ